MVILIILALLAFNTKQTQPNLSFLLTLIAVIVAACEVAP